MAAEQLIITPKLLTEDVTVTVGRFWFPVLVSASSNHPNFDSDLPADYSSEPVLLL